MFQILQEPLILQEPSAVIDASHTARDSSTNQLIYLGHLELGSGCQLVWLNRGLGAEWHDVFSERLRNVLFNAY